MIERRLNLKDAAAELGISLDALRARIRRGQYRSEKQGGRVYVYLGTDYTETKHDVQVEAALISEMQQRIAFLESELERRGSEMGEMRRLLAAALERMPAIE